jgi:hypothetical protein
LATQAFCCACAGRAQAAERSLFGYFQLCDFNMPDIDGEYIPAQPALLLVPWFQESQ